MPTPESIREACARDEATEGHKPYDQLFHGSYSQRPLEIKGAFVSMGPQRIGPNGVPKWVADVFASDPEIQSVAVSTVTNGRVYQRL